MTRDEALRLSAGTWGLVVKAVRSGKLYRLERDVIENWDGENIYAWPVSPHPRRRSRYVYLTYAGVEPANEAPL